jgi:IS30 family transposase
VLPSLLTLIYIYMHTYSNRFTDEQCQDIKYKYVNRKQNIKAIALYYTTRSENIREVLDKLAVPNMKRPISSEEGQEIIRLHNLKYLQIEIAKIVDRKQSVISNFLRDRGYNSPYNRRLTGSEKKRIIYWINKERRSLKYIGKKLHRSPTYIGEFAHKHGLYVRPPNNYLLTEIEREMMRPLYIQGRSQSTIAQTLNVAESTVQNNLTRRKVPMRTKRNRLTKRALAEIHSLRIQGWTQTALAKRFGVSQGTIWNYLNDKVVLT